MDDEGVLVGQLRALEFWCWTWLREGFSMQATKYKGVCLPRSWGLARFGNLKQLDFEEESGNCHVLSINHSLAGSQPDCIWHCLPWASSNSSRRRL